MKLGSERRQIVSRLRRPKTTVRWRLTLLYGGLFLVCGAALLAITYTLVSHATVRPTGPRELLRAGPLPSFARPPGGTHPYQFTHIPANRKTKLARFPGPQQLARVRQRLLHSNVGQAVVAGVGSNQRIVDLHRLIEESAIALGIMAVISGLLGWLVAGRVLAPLRTMTAKTQQISEANLHERLALRGPRDELRKLAETIDGLLARLEAAFDAQRRFVANASHELRTPLTTTRALLEMAMTDPNATVASFRATCAQVLEEGEQQEQLIDALLALAQSQRGIDRRGVIDLAAVVGEAIQARRPEIAARGLVLDTSLSPASLSGDRRLVERLVSNLLENATRYNISGGTVDVNTATYADKAALRIVNGGPSVPAGEIERLTQPFQRMAGDRVGHGEGLGLGLSIVAAIADAHDAAVDIRPGRTGGLEVEVRFPPAYPDHQPDGANGAGTDAALPPPETPTAPVTTSAELG